MQLQVHEAEQLCNNHAQAVPSSAREVQDANNDAAVAPAEGSSGFGNYAAPDAPSPNDFITPDDMAPTQDQPVDPRIDMDSPGSPAKESAPRNDVDDILRQLTDDVVDEVGPSGQPASVQLSSMQPIPGIDVASHMEDASASEVDSVLKDGASNDNGIADANSREADGDGCSNGTHSLATGDAAGAKQGMMEGEGITAAEGMTAHDAANGDTEEAYVTGLDGQFIGEDFNEASAAELAASDSLGNAAMANTADSSSTAAASAGGPQRSAAPLGDGPPAPASGDPAGGAQSPTPSKGLHQAPQGPTPPKAKDPPAPAGSAQGFIPAEGVHPALQGPLSEDCEELGAETPKKKKMLTLPSKLLLPWHKSDVSQLLQFD